MRLILISAWNDSGGGFTHRLFDGHPALRVWPFELLLGRDRHPVDAFGEDWFRGRFRWPRLERELASGLSDVLFDAISDVELKATLENRAAAKHALYGLDVSLQDWRAAVRTRWDRCSARTQAAFLECYIEGFFDVFDAAACSSQMAVLGHCPILILDAPEVWADFPRARLLHVVRSPFGGFVDMRRRHATLDPTSYARKWALVNGAAALWAGKRDDVVTLVSIEEIAGNRDATMRRLAERLGLAFDPTMLTPTWRGKPIDQTAMGPFGGVPDLDAVARDRDPPGLLAAERAAIEATTRGTIQLLETLGLTLL